MDQYLDQSLSDIANIINKSRIPARITHTQKLRYRGKMLRIRTASGTEFSATPDHRILVDSTGGAIMRPASDLMQGDAIYAAQRLGVAGAEPCLLDLLGDLPCYVHLRDQSLEHRLRQKHGTLRAAAVRIGFPYRCTDATAKRCFTPRELFGIGADLGMSAAEPSEVSPGASAEVVAGRDREEPSTL